MGYSNVALKDRIMQMYPDITNYGINVGLDFSDEKKAFVLKLQKDANEQLTYIDKNDADKCMDGIECIHLGVKIGEFVKNIELS